MAPVLEPPHSIPNLRLLRVLSPDPQEALTSFLFRLARFNFYDPLTLLRNLWRERMRTYERLFDSAQFPIRTASYRILTELTGIPPEVLYTLTGHSLATVLIPPYLEIPTLVLPDASQAVYLPRNIYSQRLRPVRSAPYCPLCLAERLSYRLPWLTDLVICPQHLVVLLDACSHCQAFLSIQAITSGYCPQCASDLTKAQPKSVADDSSGLLAQSHLQAWFGFADVSLLPDLGLPNTSPRILYALLNGLHRCLRRRVHPSLSHQPPSWPSTSLRVIPLGELVPTEQHYCLMATAFKTLTHWPDGFWALMDHYRLEQSGELYFAFHHQLGTLYSLYLQKLWKHPAFHFVQDAFDLYFLEHFVHKLHLRHQLRVRQSPRLQGEQPLVDSDTARRLLGIVPSAFNRWVQRGILVPAQRHPVRRFDRAQVLALKHFRQSHISQRQAASLLNLTYNLILDLTHVGLLTVHTFPAYAPSVSWFELKQVQALHQRLQAALIPCPHPCRFYSIQKVIWIFTARRLNAAQILQAILEDRLPAYYVSGSGRFTQRLRFDPDHLHCFAE